MSTYEKNLSKLTGVLEAQEIILFEKTTFLVICSSDKKSDLSITLNNNDGDKLDPKRFEKISNIMKNFKQSATKLKSQFKTLILNDSLFIVELSSNLMIFVVLEKGKIGQQVVLENIKQAKKYFQ
jgi:Ras-related GTP-binding protein A/B